MQWLDDCDRKIDIDDKIPKKKIFNKSSILNFEQTLKLDFDIT